MDERLEHIYTDKPVRTKRSGRIFLCLFLLAAAALAVLGSLYWRLLNGRQAEEPTQLAPSVSQTETSAELDRLQSSLEEKTAEVERLRSSLESSQAALDEAEQTIEKLEQYSLLTPEGTPPEYTQLYPDMYAEPWTGETVTGGKVVCLTFDDGPSANTDRVLAILEQYDVKATFFVVGRTGERDQQRMRDIVAAGHTLGVHSWSHDYPTIYESVESYLDDFHRLYQWIYDVTGTYPQVFRFPGGSINAHNRGIYQEIVSEMLRRGFVYYDWNASAQDATVHPRSAAAITADCLKGTNKDLAVVLCHDSAARTTTVDALPGIIWGYQEKGYTFMALTPGVQQVIFDYKREK